LPVKRTFNLKDKMKELAAKEEAQADVKVLDP